MSNGVPPPGWYLRPEAWGYLTPTFPWNRVVSTASSPILPFQQELPTFPLLSRPSGRDAESFLSPDWAREATSITSPNWPISGSDVNARAIAGFDDDLDDDAHSSPTLRQGWSEEGGRDFGYGTSRGGPEDLNRTVRPAPYSAQPGPYHANGRGSVFQKPPSASSWLASAPTEQQSRVRPDQLNAQVLADAQLPPTPIRLAGKTSPIPGLRPPIPPWLVPGTPEWTEHFIRGWLGLLDLFGGGGGGGNRSRRDDDDDDECLKRQEEEIDRCNKRKHEYAHRDFLRGCKERATNRWTLCLQNKGRPDPNEPSEWGPADEEIWRNYGR